MKIQSWPLTLAKVGESFRFAGMPTAWKVVADDEKQQLLTIKNLADERTVQLTYDESDKYRVHFINIIANNRSQPV